jgi:hypothetical protein
MKTLMNRVRLFEVGRDLRASRGFSKDNFTEDNQGNEATFVGSNQISRQALFLPLITEIPMTLRYLGYLL